VTTDLQHTARVALSCLDLTSLNADETAADLDRLCQRAQSPFGPVAAVCVWPRWVKRVRRQLPPTVAVAAVANFPAGGLALPDVLADIAALAEAGAQEADVVLPWRALAAGRTSDCSTWLRAVRKACGPLKLKLIIESGELAQPALIAQACELGLGEGVDFLKTSTGKTAAGATLEAADIMLRCIAQDPSAASRVGFKASGGVRTVAGAAPYVALVERHLGALACGPSRFRLGASALLDDIESVLGPVSPQSASDSGAMPKPAAGSY
jgi:deoxyribose-phosphate aldolase